MIGLKIVGGYTDEVDNGSTADFAMTDLFNDGIIGEYMEIEIEDDQISVQSSEVQDVGILEDFLEDMIMEEEEVVPNEEELQFDDDDVYELDRLKALSSTVNPPYSANV